LASVERETASQHFVGPDFNRATAVARTGIPGLSKEATPMKRHVRSFAALLTALSTFVTGCAPSRPFYFFDDGDLSHYKNVATEIEYPDSKILRLDEVQNAHAPLTVANNEPTEFWDITLEEAIQNALANNKIMRTLGGFTQNLRNNLFNSNVSTQIPSQLLSSPAAATSVYTPAIVESDPRFGTEGVLSAFDAQLSTNVFWQKNDQSRNQFFQQFSPSIFQQDLGNFNTQLSKITAAGTQVFLRHNNSYEANNNALARPPLIPNGNRFGSFWNTNIEAEFRHPLLQGAGVDFNRIAGPNAVSGFYNGVVIARINTDIALADFEAGVRNFISDTENAYWNLYQAYRTLDANIAGRDSALQTWRKVNTEATFGRADAASEAQAREQYFLFRSRVEIALSDVYQAENALRYMMGLAATDGRLCRPSDEPTTAKVTFDWQQIHTEALARSIELRRQRWVVKRREMELAASKNFLLPRLDVNGIYRFRGYGKDYWNNASNSNPEFDNAIENMLGGKQQEWQLGMQMSMPLGFRQAMAGVRNAQLQLARERSLLQEQELELSHQLAAAVRDTDREYMVSQTRFNRRAAAKRRVDAVQQTFQVGTVTVDLLLEAQRLLAEAESEYFAAIANYSRSIVQLHYRKGSLLEYNGIVLSEGPWASKAYFDAEQRARKRDAGIFLNYGFTRPQVFSQGPIEQIRNPNGQPVLEGETIFPGSVIDDGAMPSVPTPAPQLNGNGAPALPTPAPLQVPAAPIEGKATRFEEEQVENTSPLRAATIPTADARLQQDPTHNSGDMPVVERAASHEGWKSRPLTGTDRGAAVGPRL
jgi:outer membrane protein TolC